MALPFLLTVIISPEELVHLKENKKNLCLSKDMLFDGTAKTGNVVFSSHLSESLIPVVTFSWQEKYQVFGTVHFEAGARVTSDTDIGDIGGGQKAILNKDGTIGGLDPPQPGIPMVPFSVENQWMNRARIGINSYDVFRKTYSCFFVSPRVPLPEQSTQQLLPTPAYSVFWDADLKTGLMFDSENISGRFSFPLPPGKQDITLTYTAGNWSIVQ